MASAEIEHSLLRRIAVFPIADAKVSSSEDSWWQMREALTKDQRFFVASRRFMINRGVFQARKSLKPADVIILSKILDAQALIVTYLEERTLRMKVYEGENGYLLWEADAEMHPAIPIADQLIRTGSQLVNSFVLSIPYQGFQIVDDLIGKPVYDDDNVKLAQVFIGSTSQIQLGDRAQWIQVTGDVGQAFFNNATRVTVIAEGKVRAIKGDRAIVEIEKLKDLADLKENALVRFPKEFNRLKDLYTTGDRVSNLSPEYLSSEIRNVKELNQTHNPTASALAWIINIAAFILLAF